MILPTVARAGGVHFVHLQLRVLHQHDDGGARSWFLVQPLRDHPVVDRAGETGAHVLIEQLLDAVQTVGDGV